jgi:hypothetical protein
LVAEAGRLWLDVTAAVAVVNHDVDATRIAGVDVGIIHPYAVACGDQALVVSGRRYAPRNGCTWTTPGSGPNGWAASRRRRVSGGRGVGASCAPGSVNRRSATVGGSARLTTRPPRR